MLRENTRFSIELDVKSGELVDYIALPELGVPEAPSRSDNQTQFLHILPYQSILRRLAGFTLAARELPLPTQHSAGLSAGYKDFPRPCGYTRYGYGHRVFYRKSTDAKRKWMTPITMAAVPTMRRFEMKTFSIFSRVSVVTFELAR